MAMDCSASVSIASLLMTVTRGTARHRVAIVSDDVPHLTAAKVLAQRRSDVPRRADDPNTHRELQPFIARLLSVPTPLPMWLARSVPA